MTLSGKEPGAPLNPSFGLSGIHEAGIATDKD